MPAGESRQLVIQASVPPEAIDRPSAEIILRLEALDADIAIERDSRFIGETR